MRGLHDGFQKIPFVRPLDQMGYHLRIGLALEAAPFGLELASELCPVLNDAVVDDGEAPVLASMRVRIRIGRRSVGCPSGVPDARAPPGIAVLLACRKKPREPSA